MHPEEWSHLLALEGHLQVHTSETQQGSWMDGSDGHYHLRERLVSGDCERCKSCLNLQTAWQSLPTILAFFFNNKRAPGHGTIGQFVGWIDVAEFHLTELMADDDISINLVSIWSSTPSLKADGYAQAISLAHDIVHEPDAQLQLCRRLARGRPLLLPFLCRNLAVNMDVDRASHVVLPGSFAEEVAKAPILVAP